MTFLSLKYILKVSSVLMNVVVLIFIIIFIISPKRKPIKKNITGLTSVKECSSFQQSSKSKETYSTKPNSATYSIKSSEILVLCDLNKIEIIFKSSSKQGDVAEILIKYNKNTSFLEKSFIKEKGGGQVSFVGVDKNYLYYTKIDINRNTDLFRFNWHNSELEQLSTDI